MRQFLRQKNPLYTNLQTIFKYELPSTTYRFIHVQLFIKTFKSKIEIHLKTLSPFIFVLLLQPSTWYKHTWKLDLCIYLKKKKNEVLQNKGFYFST